MLKGDSMLWTLHSDTKINISDPNLNVKMFNHYFFSDLSKNEAVKLLFTLFNMFYYNIIFLLTYIVSCNTSQIFFCYTADSLKWFQNYFYYISTKYCEKKTLS